MVLTGLSVAVRTGFIDSLNLPRSPGTHVVGPWVIDSLISYRDLRTGTQYIGNWASRDCSAICCGAPVSSSAFPTQILVCMG